MREAADRSGEQMRAERDGSVFLTPPLEFVSSVRPRLLSAMKAHANGNKQANGALLDDEASLAREPECAAATRDAAIHFCLN